MNKSQLIDVISINTELSKKDVETAINAFIDVVTDALVDGEKITITGFGSFEVVERAARTGRNPQTGETISIQKSKSPKFKSSKNLKETVNR